MEYGSLVALGLLAGFASGFFGIGGGTVLVPLLMLLGLDIKSAVGISVMQMVFSSVFGSWVNYKNGFLKVNEGIILGLGGLFGASFSGFLLKGLDEIILEIVFCVALGFSIYRFFKVPIEPIGKENNRKLLLFSIGAVIGLLAISLGIGGALFLTPILVGFLHYDIKKAVSMGLFFVIFSSSSGFLSMAYNGLINYSHGTIVGVASLFGVFFGVKMSHKISKSFQKRILLALYIVLFILMIQQLTGI